MLITDARRRGSHCHACAVLFRWIREVADEPMIIDPAARNIEARKNTWSVSASVDERASISAHDLAAAWEERASIIRDRIRMLEYAGPATFYVWHDRQAGQLRCSTTSLPPDQLPFRSRVELDTPLAAIAEAFLTDASPDQISWQELRATSTHDSAIDGDQNQTDNVDHIVARDWTADVGRTP